MKKILLFVCFAFLVCFLTKAQSNLQITFFAGSTPLAGQDTVYMYSGVATGSPGNFNQYGTGFLAQPLYPLIGLMTKIGQDQWSICLEPFAYFSQGPGGSIPAGTTLYGIGDIAFHNPSGSIMVQLNNSSINFRIEFVSTSSAFISWQGSNSPGQMTANNIPCNLGIDDLHNSNGVLANFPNPLTEKTKFIYTLKSSGKVSLKVFNSIGQIVKTIVRDQVQGPNTYSYDWSGDNDMGRKLYNGVYYYTLTVNDKTVQTNKLIITR